MPYDAPPDFAAMSLPDIAEAMKSRKLPPVEQWNPAETLDSQMTIAANGTWFHEGRPISRPAMVRAFASLLMRDDKGRHWLMTPQAKHSIEVEDAAFIAVDCRRQEGALAFRLNTDELVIAGPDNPLRAEGDPDMPAVYLSIRNGCEARINRSTWLQLAEIALAEGGGDLSVTSRGVRFALSPQ